MNKAFIPVDWLEQFFPFAYVPIVPCEGRWSCKLDIFGKVRKLAGSKGFIPFRYQGQYEHAETGCIRVGPMYNLHRKTSNQYKWHYLIQHTRKKYNLSWQN